MGLLDIFFTKGDDPWPQYEDDLLGPMVWSEEDEAWVGEYGGVKYLIASDRQAAPTNEALAYARMVLADPGALERAVERAKGSAAAESPWRADEIAGPRLGAVYFSAHQAKSRILADWEGGQEGRSWRVEFGEDGCEGIWFDT